MNYDYDYNTEYGDGDIPDIDKPRNRTSNALDTKKQPKNENPNQKPSDET